MKPHICFVAEQRAAYGLLTGEACESVGGAELQQTLIASALQKLGYTITFLVPDLGQPMKVVTEQRITLIKTRPPVVSDGGMARFAKDFIRLFKAMRIADADIYYQRTSANLTGITALFCKLNGRQFVFSVAHNMDLDNELRLKIKGRKEPLYKYGLNHADAIIVQTDDQLRLLRENAGRDGMLIRSTYLPPDDTERTIPQEHVLWVGNFRTVKRPDMFLDLADRLPDYRFVMIGGVAKEEPLVYENTSERAKSMPNVQLVGAVPYKEVGRYFAGALVFVNTSLSEGFPNTYLQAWCRGVPVVGTFDADELISKHDLGKHCRDVGEIADAVKAYMENKKLCESTGERAVRYVRERHSPDAVAAQYDRIFTQLHEKR